MNNKTPYYVYTYFRFFGDVVRIVNTHSESFITQEQIDVLVLRDEVPFLLFLKLRIFSEIDGVYELEPRVLDFVSFSNNDFSLNSPESVQKYHSSFYDLYQKLLAASNSNDIVRYGHQLISELNGFSNTLDESATRLLQDTLRLKENVEEISARERLDKATEIIDEYVIPLKKIVEDRPEAILPLVRDIGSIANHKGINKDKNVESLMRRLRIKADQVHKNTELFGKKIVGELFTLKKIKKSSASLAGAIAWLENTGEIEPSGICEVVKPVTHAKEFFFEAIEEFEFMSIQEEDVFIPSPEEIRDVETDEQYHFNRKSYLVALSKELPVSNIYTWIYDELKTRGELSYKNFCTTQGILDVLEKSYTEKRDVLNFEEFNLNVPIVEVTEIQKGYK